MYEIIGKDIKRLDGWEKVTGKAVYGHDLRLPDLLHAACRYVDIPCGKITGIDTGKARELEGVKAVLVAEDLPYHRKIGPIRQDHNILVSRKVFYHGDVVAVIAAEEQSTALAACELIDVDYVPETGVYDLREAADEQSRLVHPEYKSNTVVHYPLRKGNVRRGFQTADQVISRSYSTGFAEHAYIEPESVIVAPDPSTKGFRIYGSIQNPYTTRKIVAQCFKLDLNRINVCPSTLGGSFGGKDDIINVMACRATALVLKTGRPVKLTNSRENSIRESYKRHPYLMDYKAGFKNNGRITAMKIKILADSGAYSSQSFFVTWRSVVQATGPYEIENVETDIKAVYTNNCYTAAFRGFGSPQIIFAQESLMDEIAAICGISPVEVRKINGLRQGSITATGQILTGHRVSLETVIDRAVRESSFLRKRDEFDRLNSSGKRFKYGIGLACSYRGCSLGAEGTDASSAIVSVQADGSVYVIAALNENGQGLRTTFSMIAAEILGLDPERIIFLEPSTAVISDGGPTVASRSTLMGGRAVQKAARKVRKEIFSVIKQELGVSRLSQTVWEKGRIKSKAGLSGLEGITFDQAAEKAYKSGRNLSAYGWYKAPEVSWDEEKGQGKAYFTYVYGCQVAEVKLDTSTGSLEVMKVTACHDPGRIINKLGAEGQVYGGVAQGLGYAVMEDVNISSGRIRASNFDQYLIPTSVDIKRIDPVFVSNPDRHGPFGAKSLGEPTLELTAAAINNAVTQAAGKRSYSLPLSLEQVFLGKNLQKPSRQSEKTNKANRKHQPALADINIESPTELDQILELLSTGKWKILAGGTDLTVNLRSTKKTFNLIDLHRITGMDRVKVVDGFIRIGAMTPFSRILTDDKIKKLLPVLHKACTLIGSPQIRNMATLAGNIVNAAPCADSIPPLMLYEASVILLSQREKRQVPIGDFITGSYRTAIKKDEIMTEIVIPIPSSDKNFQYSYFQLGRRQAVNITRISLGLLLKLDDNRSIRECRLAQGALFPAPSRLEEIEIFLKDKELTPELPERSRDLVEKILKKKLRDHWSAGYKIPVFFNIFRDSLLNIYNELVI